ncbi:Hypothetical predicted protein [Lecanosticta acicola]|uniref:SPT2 chromatin protein n=1 Tax=Lecanosticta acicola TaxID=111012 RepID=A0AAI8Z3V4_9PEZI|nr:Hypothetical predicted protein [Lecanosticta acicola]
MTSFSSLLSSISGQPATPQPKTPTSRPNGASEAARPQAPTNAAKPTPNNVAAGVKRKPEDQVAAGNAKVFKTEVKVPVRSSGQSTQPAAAKPALSSVAGPNGAYRGTARPAGAVNPAKPISKPIAKPNAATASSTAAYPTPGSPATQPKKGFASIMAQAKAAQEAAKAAGHSVIKHKPVEKMTKRERTKMQEEAALKQKTGGAVGKLAVNDRSRSNTPVDAKNGLQKKAPASTYKGTMKKNVERQQSTYKGTMNKAAPAAAQSKLAGKKNSLAQDKYGGYASWDDLDEAEDEEEEEEGYDSEGSSDMMDAGFDDMEREETAALKAARQEDQEALEEEERHRREKLERKKKLQALSRSAAAKKKF